MRVKKVKVVSNWRQCWKWFSVQSMAINTAVVVAWATLPEEFKQSFSPNLVAVISSIVFVLGVVGRLIDQEYQQPTIQEDDCNGHNQ